MQNSDTQNHYWRFCSLKVCSNNVASAALLSSAFTSSKNTGVSGEIVGNSIEVVWLLLSEDISNTKEVADVLWCETCKKNLQYTNPADRTNMNDPITFWRIQLQNECQFSRFSSKKWRALNFIKMQPQASRKIGNFNSSTM